MPFHKSHHLILSAPDVVCKSEDTTGPHLSFQHVTRTDKQNNPNVVSLIPKWVYQKKQGVDQVNLEVPGINMDDVALFVSNRDLIVSALRRINSKDSRRVHCEYFFKMRLADNSDTNAVTSNYQNGILNIRIPRVRSEVKKIIPAFVHNKNAGTDEVKLFLAGVKSEDIKWEVNDRTITVVGLRYDESDGLKILEVEYFFTITPASNSDLSAICGTSDSGIFTLVIPRKPEEVQEICPVHSHEKKTAVDIVTIDLPGTTKEDIKIDSIGKRLHVRANRFEDEGNVRVLKSVYMFYMDFPQNNELQELYHEFDDGVLTVSIPRYPLRGCSLM